MMRLVSEFILQSIFIRHDLFIQYRRSNDSYEVNANVDELFNLQVAWVPNVFMKFLRKLIFVFSVSIRKIKMIPFYRRFDGIFPDRFVLRSILVYNLRHPTSPHYSICLTLGNIRFCRGYNSYLFLYIF